jgi:hypothetical protein
MGVANTSPKGLGFVNLFACCALLTDAVQENFDKRETKSTDNLLPLRHSLPLKVVKQHGKVKSNSMEMCPA